MDMSPRRRKKAISSDQEESNVEKLYSILGNPHKRKIIALIGRKGQVSFTELRRSLKMSVGNLYYNLDHLRGIIYQDENRKYALTEEGQKIYKVLIEESRRLNYILREKNPVYRFYHKYIDPLLLPENFFLNFYNNLKLALLSSILPLILIIYMAFMTNFHLDILEYSELTNVETIKIWIFSIDKTSFIIIKNFFSWVIIVLFIDIVSLIMGSDLTSRPEYFLSSLVALAPLLIFPLTHQIILMVMGGNMFSVFVSALIYRLLQVFTLGFLTAIIAIYKEMSKDRAFIIVFLLFYISYTLKFLGVSI